MIKRLDKRYIPSLKELQDKINEVINSLNSIPIQPLTVQGVTIPNRPPRLIPAKFTPYSPEQAKKFRDGK